MLPFVNLDFSPAILAKQDGLPDFQVELLDFLAAADSNYFALFLLLFLGALRQHDARFGYLFASMGFDQNSVPERFDFHPVRNRHIFFLLSPSSTQLLLAQFLTGFIVSKLLVNNYRVYPHANPKETW